MSAGISRGELNSPEVELQHPREGLDELGFAEAGHAFEQHIAAGENGRQRSLDDATLADDDTPTASRTVANSCWN